MSPATRTCISDPRLRRRLAVFAALAALLALVTVAGAEQAARVPVSLAGRWALDPYVSDHPEQLARALRFLTAEPRVDAGSPVRSRLGPGRSGDVPREPLTDSDRKLLTALTDAVRFPPPSLTISQTDGTVTMAADSGTAVTMHTNGKVEKHTLTAGTVGRTAIWEGPQLIVSYEVGRAGLLRYIYLRAPTTGQLVIRVDFDRRRGEGSAFDVRLVYNPAVPAPHAQRESPR